MQIAVPSNDQQTVCSHAGRAKGCVVVEVPTAGDPVVTYRSKADYAAGINDHHDAVLKLVDGCQVFICSGMGQGLYDALVQAGIQVVVTRADDAAEAVEQFLAGNMLPVSELSCVGGGDHDCGCDCHHA